MWQRHLRWRAQETQEATTPSSSITNVGGIQSSATPSGNNSGTNNTGKTAGTSNATDAGETDDTLIDVSRHVPPFHDPNLDHLILVEFECHVAGGPIANWGLDGRI